MLYSTEIFRRFLKDINIYLNADKKILIDPY